MVRRYLPLNPLRAFEAAARHLSFTRAAIELNVTHAAVSQQVRALEEQLGCVLFTRVSRGLVLTHEGEGLLPVLNEAFDRIADTLECFSHGQFRERVKVGAVGTFAAGWLLPRLAGFYDSHPHIDLHISTHNNHVDPAAEGHDYTIRFGNGAWHESDAELIFSAPHAPLCSPAIAEQLQQPDDVHRFTLLRSFRRDEWSRWLDCAGGTPPSPSQPVMVFDTSLAMAEAAQLGAGVAIAPVCMFSRLLQSGALVQPFAAVRTASGVLHDFGLTAAIPAPCLCRDNINMQCAALRHGITAGDIKTEMQCTLLNIRQCADFQPDIRYPRNAVLFSLFADNVRRTEGFTKLAPSAVVIIGYGIAFYFLSLVLKSIPVGVAYAVWSGLGVVIITAIAWLLHGQKLDAWGFVGMGLIIAAFLLARSPSWKSLRRPTPW